MNIHRTIITPLSRPSIARAAITPLRTHPHRSRISIPETPSNRIARITILSS